MKLDDAQTARVREWIQQGLKVAEVQNRLASEFGLRLTYMEARFLLDDLQLQPKDPPPPPKPTGGPLAVPGAESRPGAAGAPGRAPAGAEVPGGEPRGGGVRVSVDQLARPGAMVSGKVTFRDGQTAEWQLDQAGRLAVMPQKQGYKPSQADVMDFQMELESALSKFGY